MHEHDSELQGSKPFYKPGHIGPLIYEHMNMIGVESAFVSGLQHTKASLVKTVQQRVDDINTLLRGVGGFNRQLKPSFSRSSAVYLEQDDINYRHREKVVFSVNIADFELRHPLDDEAANSVCKDGRSCKRYGWDFAVNVLSEIVSNTGLKPKYVKNDKINSKFVMSQSLLTTNDPMPDEYFSFILEYLTEERLNQKIEEYNAHVDSIKKKIENGKQKLNNVWRAKREKAQITEEVNWYEKELAFFIGTTSDPNELDTGLLFTIEISTLKDYSITKDKMQVIMSKYLVALSNIAKDKSMDQQLATDYSKDEDEILIQGKSGVNTRRQTVNVPAENPNN
jgi:hypothetical protein